MRKNLHILLRYSDRLYKTNAFKEHKALEESFGYVWWGKFGLGVSNVIVNKVKEQIKNGNTTYLFLTHSTYLKYQAEIIEIVGGGELFEGTPKDIAAIPEYYRMEKCSVWFKIRNLKQIDKDSLESLKLYNEPTERPKLGGMRPLMYVTINEN